MFGAFENGFIRCLRDILHVARLGQFNHFELAMRKDLCDSSEK